jgi:hypothetical protein
MEETVMEKKHEWQRKRRLRKTVYLRDGETGTL